MYPARIVKSDQEYLGDDGRGECAQIGRETEALGSLQVHSISNNGLEVVERGLDVTVGRLRAGD